MSKILLSIKPKYVEKILSGEKKYEYRKFQCKNEIDSIVIYSTAPVKKVIAEVKILDIVKGTPKEVWDKTKEFGGIIEKDYFEYYKNKTTAIAYYLGEITKFEQEKTLKDYGLNYTPQSFAYI